MKIETETHRVVDIPLGGGTTLRAALTRDGEAGDCLVLSRGFGAPDEAFRRPHWAGDPLVLPASIIGELRAALDALEVEP